MEFNYFLSLLQEPSLIFNPSFAENQPRMTPQIQ
jgi:hypothetical protein